MPRVSLGNPEIWADFVNAWTNALNNIPLEKLKTSIPDIKKRMKQAKSNMGIIFTFSIIAMIISALVIAQPALSLLKTVASYLLFEAGHSLFLKAVVFAAQN